MGNLDFRKRVVAIDLQLTGAEPPMEMVPLLVEKATSLSAAHGLIHDAVQLGYSAAAMAYHKLLFEALEATLDERDDRNKRAADMRERAAKLVERSWDLSQIAAAIRSLPLDGEKTDG